MEAQFINQICPVYSNLPLLAAGITYLSYAVVKIVVEHAP
jgi:hypothetical protein